MASPALPTLRSRLFLVAAAALLPAALLSVLALGLFTTQVREDMRGASVKTVRALVTAIDNSLAQSVVSLQTLSASNRLDEGDLGGFYRVARRVLQERSEWTTIGLLDPRGRERVNLLFPLGARSAEEFSDPRSFARVKEHLKPVVSSMTVERPSGKPVFLVRVPVMREGRLIYVLSATVRPEAILATVSEQAIAQDSVVAVLDSERSIVARSRRHAEFVGVPATDDLRRALSRDREGWEVLNTRDGQRVFTAYARSDSTEWAVAYGVPEQTIYLPVVRSSVLMACGVALSILLGILAAFGVGRRISGPIGKLREAALTLERGERPTIPTATLREVNDVAEALRNAAEARWRAEAALQRALAGEREARDVAETANRVKDRFLAMLGHELRNPLAAISGAVTAMDLPGMRQQERARALDIVRRQTRHLARLTDDLLDVTRVLTGKITLQLQRMDLFQAVKQCLETIGASGALAAHEVSLEGEQAFIEGDPHRIAQIVSNLLVNAGKYTPAGLRITIRVRRSGDEAEFEVRDQGIGMEPALMNRVFNLFVQADDARQRNAGGLGIGLTLVQELVKLHGGRVSAESEGPGRGSTFRVGLPLAARAEAPAHDVVVTPPRAPARRVLVVEDNEDARTMMCLLLRADGHTVEEAADGPGGIAAALQHRPEFALIDLGLPGLQGTEVARQIRSAAPDIILVALTGYGTPEDRDACLAAGFDLHLTKPVDTDRLQSLLGGQGRAGLELSSDPGGIT